MVISASQSRDSSTETTERRFALGVGLTNECNLACAFCYRDPTSLDRLSLAITERRSEEHTSELQSRQYLVCRLLLEKKTERRPEAQRLTASPGRCEPAGQQR